MSLTDIVNGAISKVKQKWKDSSVSFKTWAIGVGLSTFYFGCALASGDTPVGYSFAYAAIPAPLGFQIAGITGNCIDHKLKQIEQMERNYNGKACM